MSDFLSRLWPKRLAARLVLLLVAALAAAQLILVLALHNEQNHVAEQLVHGQALGQTVTLARLLDQYAPDESETILRAFGSRQSCARIVTGPQPAPEMTDAEEQLAKLLGVMLHGVHAASPYVTIAPAGAFAPPCQDAGPPPGAARPTPDASADGGRPDSAFLAEHPRVAAVVMTVPLDDGRIVSMRTAVSVPGGWNPAAIWSFGLSSILVALVAVVAVRRETRSLRVLADASERFGRGETVPALTEAGPSEVVAVIRAFNTMQQRLSLYLRDRLRLLAGISHDLRTPLTTLRLKAEFVEDEAVRDDIVATIDELTIICEATLAFSRAEAITEATETVDLAGLVEEVVASFQLAKADVTFEPRGPCPYACRPVALKRALRNLIENAVRYGSRARIAIAAADGGPVISIDDDGPGLPAEAIEEAFKPFVRLEASRNRETGGIGLGLAIARSIVGAHAGTLTLANRQPHGLRAEIRLPGQGQSSAEARRP